MRTTDEVRRHIGYWAKAKVISDLAVRVGELLEQWQGLHHLDDVQMRKVDWSNAWFLSMTIDSTLATFDFNDLTRLVFLAHDSCVRVQVSGAGKRKLELMFHPRKREGSASQRHPTLEDAVALWRESNPTTNGVIDERAAG